MTFMISLPSPNVIVLKFILMLMRYLNRMRLYLWITLTGNMVRLRFLKSPFPQAIKAYYVGRVSSEIELGLIYLVVVLTWSIWITWE